MKNPVSKLMGWYFSKRALPYWCILLLDCIVVFFSGVLIYYLFHRGYQTMNDFHRLAPTLLIYLAVTVVYFRIFHTYSGIIRFSSFVDLKRMLYAGMLSMVTVLGIHYPMYKLPKETFVNLNSRQIIGMYAIATLIMWMVRVLVKTVYENISQVASTKDALIYGIHDGGVGLAKDIRTRHPQPFNLKGFITDEEGYDHTRIMGERVYFADDSLATVIRNEGIQAVLVSPMRVADFQNNQYLQDLLINAGVKIYMVEGAHEWTADDDGKPMVLKEVSVEDLLPRDEINIDMSSIASSLAGKKILITGSAGSIGSEMVRQVAKFKPAAMMLIDEAETPQHDIRLEMMHDYPDIKAYTVVTSICKKERMEHIFSSFKPDYVFHAAAYKHVPMMEDNPCEAVQNNIWGTKIIADMSVKYGVKKFVMVSTDKAVNPTNVMGCSKRICEIYCQSLNEYLHHEEAPAQGKATTTESMTQFVTTRFGNVLGSNGSVIPLFKKQIREGGPVTVTDPNIVRYFMLIPEACKLVLEAGVKGKGGEIFVFDMGKPVKIVDLARRMIALSGAKNVEIKFTGLREGEKLYEEVLSNLEGTTSSFHKKIRIAKVRTYDFNEASNEIDELIDISRQYDDMATVRKMKEIVPEYISNNSVYDILDKQRKETS